MTPFKIVTSGDYVQLIYVDAISESVQQELRSDTDAFECSYDSDGKLFMQFGSMRFENPEPTDFTINGSAVTDAADFISKLTALFTGGGGGGATIYTGDGSLPGTRTIDLNGKILEFEGSTASWYMDDGGGAISQSVKNNFTVGDFNAVSYLVINTTPGGEVTQFGATSSADPGSISKLFLSSGNESIFNFELVSISAAQSHTVRILGNAGTGIIAYTADTHTFSGVINLPTQAAPSAPNDGDIWREDNTDTGLKIRINGLTKTITVS